MIEIYVNNAFQILHDSKFYISFIDLISFSFVLTQKKQKVKAFSFS